jgi:hypothetical protein
LKDRPEESQVKIQKMYPKTEKAYRLLNPENISYQKDAYACFHNVVVHKIRLTICGHQKIHHQGFPCSVGNGFQKEA